MLPFAKIYEETVDVDQQVEEKDEYIAEQMGEVKKLTGENDDAMKMLRIARERHRNVAEI